VDDAHLLERLDDQALDAEVGEGLGPGSLGGLCFVSGLGGGERLVRRRDVGLVLGLVLVIGLVVEEILVQRRVLGLELGVVQDVLGRVRVGLRVQRFACLRLRWPREPARRERIAVPRGRRPGRR
jgi:hypothetical protein